MKILVLGAAGQVGWQLRRSLGAVGEVVAMDRQTHGAAADLAQPEALAATVRSVAPQVIVNAGAYTAVDKAESETEQAFAVNGHACEVLASEAAKLDAWLVHYSTDYVFNGRGARPWVENDATDPVNAYGRSKLAGEHAIAAHCPKHVVLRTCWVFDTWGGNFLKTILRAASQREELSVVNDQWGVPTRAALIADVTAHVVRGLQADRAGVYHLAAGGETNWHAYATFAVEQALQAGAALKVTPDRIRPVDSSQFKTAAARPANSRMDTRKLRDTFGLALPPWQDGVSAVVRELAAYGILPSKT